jgi:hypothetical protein
MKINTDILRQHSDEIYITNLEFLALMKISSSTAYSWRRHHMISFYQIFGKIYYTMKDINIMMENNHYKVKKKINFRVIALVLFMGYSDFINRSLMIVRFLNR